MGNKNQLALWVVLVTLLFSACAQKGEFMTSDNTAVSAAEAKALMKKGTAVIIDVRTPEEVEEYALDFTLKIPLDELPSSLGELPKDKAVITACASGRRAQKAQEFLSENGFKAKYIDGPITQLGGI